MIHARDGSPEEVEPDEENEPGPRSWPEENENPTCGAAHTESKHAQHQSDSTVTQFTRLPEHRVQSLPGEQKTTTTTSFGPSDPIFQHQPRHAHFIRLLAIFFPRALWSLTRCICVSALSKGSQGSDRPPEDRYEGR